MKNLTKHELQQALLLHGKNFHTFLGVSYQVGRKVIKDHGLKTSLEYVKAMSSETMLAWLANLGSWKKVSKHFNVSESFLRNQFIPFPSVVASDLPPTLFLATPEKFSREIKRLGSVALAARVWGCRESVIRKCAKEQCIDLTSLISYVDTGFENAKGRKAELWFKKLRGDKIIKDCNEEDTQAEIDFVDEVAGNVDVKSSQPYEYMSKKRAKYKKYWKFSVKGLSEKADWIVAVAMDKKYEDAVYNMFIPAAWVMGKGTIMINEVVFKYYKKQIETLAVLSDGPGTFKQLVLNQDYTHLVEVDSLRGR